MRVLLIGSGGREHAIAWKLRQSRHVQELYCAPGNAGIEEYAMLVPIKAAENEKLLAFAQEQKIDLTVVGPEQPLVEGIVDAFEERGLKIFGPRKAAALLEGSKAYSKNFMQKYSIPTARFKSFSANEVAEANRFLQGTTFPVVLKADGLAAGKGVLISETKEKAQRAFEDIAVKKAFGAAGEKVVIEEFLEGEEVSVFVVTDGTEFVTLASAQDHKRIFDGDRGKNTGGMGAYAPAPIVDEALLRQITEQVVRPTLDGMRKEGTPYRGCLYCGLMITKSGPKVLEYNCRFGDPETQVVIPLIAGDFAELLFSVADGRLDNRNARLHSGSAVCVVMASKGYPDEYETGKVISGFDKFSHGDDVVVFHAGTKKNGSDILTAGGRVLGVTAIGQNLESTIQKAYQAVEKISFDGAQYRRDIGQKALKRLDKAQL
ncbi:MAG: phosphoribosylamine--glycine ligase [Ignavibacteriae bacterium]|nr:phosphoribosylamine--glycine ligase [Ignavibacteriota bacterium]